MLQHRFILTAALSVVPLLFSGCTMDSPPPADAFSGDEGGCGDFFVYRNSKDRRWMLTVTVDRLALPGYQLPDTLDLAANAEAVQVEALLQASTSEPEPCGCIPGEPAVERWKAVAGTVSIRTAELEKPYAEENYRVSVQLDGLELESPDTGTRFGLEPIEINNVVVGWFAG